MSAPTADYAFLVTATVMVHVTAGHEAAALEELNAALGDECDLPSTAKVSGMRLSAITLDQVEHLDQVDGVPVGELCRNDGCREPLGGGSWDGECGSCADRACAEEEWALAA